MLTFPVRNDVSFDRIGVDLRGATRIEDAVVCGIRAAGASRKRP